MRKIHNGYFSFWVIGMLGFNFYLAAAQKASKLVSLSVAGYPLESQRPCQTF
jgi:hypothetical protein